jgi:hypothetical protein
MGRHRWAPAGTSRGDKVVARNIIRFLSLFFVALALVPSGAHLAELPNKIHLAREHYLIVQQIYRGWALWGAVVFGALIATLLLTFINRDGPRRFTLSLIAFLCIVGTQIVFWTFTYPTNVATQNWTILPDNWLELRRQWEYSHAVSAVLNMIALIVTILSLL